MTLLVCDICADPQKTRSAGNISNKSEEMMPSGEMGFLRNAKPGNNYNGL